MTTLKKILFWAMFAFSILVLILSVLYSYEPEWFSGLIAYLEPLGITESQVSAILATLGSSGTVGTLGFSFLKSTISNIVTNDKRLSQETIGIVNENLNQSEVKIATSYNKLYDQYISQDKNIQAMKKEIAEQKNAFATLSSAMYKLVDLEIINLNKTIENPLTNEETANKLRESIENLSKGKVIVAVGQEIIDSLTQDNKVEIEKLNTDNTDNTTNTSNTSNTSNTDNTDTNSNETNNEETLKNETSYDGTSI